MLFRSSSYDHVHIGIETGDISQFLDSNGKLKCGGGTISGSVLGAPSDSLPNDKESEEEKVKKLKDYFNSKDWIKDFMSSLSNVR